MGGAGTAIICPSRYSMMCRGPVSHVDDGKEMGQRPGMDGGRIATRPAHGSSKKMPTTGRAYQKKASQEIIE